LCVSGLHRRLGLAGASLAIGLVVSGYMATVQMVRRGFDLSGDLTALPGGAMAQTVFQFGNLLVFSILVGLGLFLRRSRETHKRLLALAVLQTLLATPVAHLVGHFALPVVLLPCGACWSWPLSSCTTDELGDAFTPSRSGEVAD
jgi:ethanolamine transporter EutH